MGRVTAIKYLQNRELQELTKESDYFGHIEKGNAMISFLSSNIEFMSQSNMVALYGKWGSGKSTLMKYIGSELEKVNYKSLYFPAWEFEKDENLPLSLTHFITNETGISGEKGVDIFMKNAGEVLKSLGKGLSIDTQILKFDLANVINSEEDYYKKEAERNESRYTKTKDFKGKFKLIEELIIKKSKKKKIIIFIDDLDRCEPENVLKLISTIKLFFTYSNDIVFMFGCDKDAIAKAVQHKYGDVIKADEYLEKVIDVSFNMPQEISVKKLIEVYFPLDINENGNNLVNVCEDLEVFFKSIGFTNPRHLKKILNKFEIVKGFKKIETNIGVQNDLIPKITIETEEDLMMVKFILVCIILHEFYNETFNVLMRFEQKKAYYITACRNYLNQSNNNSPSFKTASAYLHNNFLILNSLDITFKDIQLMLSRKTTQGQNSDMSFNYFLTIFTPTLHSNTFDVGEGRQLISQFYSNNTAGDVLALKFCEYLWENRQVVLNIKSDYKIINLFKICQVLL